MKTERTIFWKRNNCSWLSPEVQFMEMMACTRASPPCFAWTWTPRHVISAFRVSSKVIQAIRFRLLSPEVLQHGWVLDDFPCTKAQVGLVWLEGFEILILQGGFHLAFYHDFSLRKWRTLGRMFDKHDFQMAELPIAIQLGGLPAVGQFGQV